MPKNHCLAILVKDHAHFIAIVPNGRVLVVAISNAWYPLMLDLHGVDLARPSIVIAIVGIL